MEDRQGGVGGQGGQGADVTRLFVFAVMWSVGALLELEDRVKMEVFLKGHSAHLDLPHTEGEQTIFEFMVNEQGQWEHWENKVPQCRQLQRPFV